MLSIVTISGAMAQSRTITGKVTAAEDGLPLPGVSVKVNGTGTGVSTGMDGNYSIVLPQGAGVLEFSYIGFVRQDIQVGSGNVLNVALVTDSKQLSEVVVTALGMSKEKKSLGYAATQVGTEEINRTSPVSMLDGLQGKVAGVNISSQSGAPGASSKVILRGYSSVNGSNQPLYIIDGVPVDNTRFGTTGTNRATDFGNNANDINPNDIETINILKGAAASNLYGSRAANGVIVITTKKGKAGKLNIDFNSSATLSSVLMTPTLQNVYGQGWSAEFVSEENGSWGPRMDGKLREWGNPVDNVRLKKAFAPQDIKGFYDRGSELNNSISVSGGNEKSTFYFSYGNVGSNGVVPGNSDTYDRNSFSIRGSTTARALKIAASLNYVNRNSSVVTAGQGTSTGATTFQELIQMPRDIPVTGFKDYRNKYFNEDNYFTPYATNPYFSIAENGNDFNNERFYGNVNLDYQFLPWLSSSLTVGTDVSDSRIKEWTAINAPLLGSPNAGRSPDVGSVIESSLYRGEINADWITSMNRKLSDSFTIDGMIGVNLNERNARNLAAQITGLTIPKFYALSNSSAPPVSMTGYSKRRLVGTYAQANVAYNNYLYLTLNARNDWSSTLPSDRNSYFYPGASLSFVLTDAVNGLNNYGLSFAKFRASWGKTGNDADPYLVASVLAKGDVGLNFGNITFPFGGVNSYEISNLIGNSKLSPELTTEYEFGTDMRFLNNRVGIDFSYYNKNTRDQIFTVPVPATTGYTSRVVNFGSIENKGVEIGLNATPVKSNRFQWDMTYTFTRNRNKVLELPEGLTKVTINNAYGVEFIARVGMPLGVYEGPAPARDPQGRIIVNPSSGRPLLADQNEEYGSAQRDYTMGLVNQISYKNVNLGFSFDYRQGGLFWSYTAHLNNFVGNSVGTLYNDRRPFIVPNSVIKVTGENGEVTYVENTTPVNMTNFVNYWSTSSNSAVASRMEVLDKTFLKLRDVTLSYTLPKTVAGRLKASNITLTAFGRNLLMWLPKENTFIDPEVSTYNNDLSGEWGEFAGGPTNRSYGLSLKASF